MGRGRDSVIVQQGKWKGYRREDVEDVYWAEGYSLPKLTCYAGWKLQTFAEKSISDSRVNIERLPRVLRYFVNQYHAEYGVGRVKDINTFNVNCSNHPGPTERKCRQCRARVAALKLNVLIAKGIHLSRGLLVRRKWVIPKTDELETESDQEKRMEAIQKYTY